MDHLIRGGAEEGFLGLWDLGIWGGFDITSLQEHPLGGGSEAGG